MEPWQKDSTDNLLQRLKAEIIPVIEKAMSDGNASYANPNIVKCWETLDCKADDCSLYQNSSGAVRCWQVPDTYCNGQAQGSFSQKYHECRDCRVFKDSCPTIIEELGEHINNMVFLLNEQREKSQKDKQYIDTITQRLNSVTEQLKVREREIQEIMITDKLTTLFNRQHLITVLEDEIARCQRYDRPLALILIDIDEFRSFNEMYGHQAGDEMLSFVGTLIKENTRKFDRAFRYGGEEFVVVLPESDLTMAYIVAERIRKGFESSTFPVTRIESGEREDASRTISIGVTATYAFGIRDVRIEDLISQTEKALYEAKEKGGNLCIRYE